MLVLVCCWHVEQVSEWLRMVGLEELACFFRDAAVDGAGLLQLRQVSCSFSSILILQDLGGPEMFYRRADLWAFLCVTCGLGLCQLSTTDADTFYATAESKLGIRKFGLVSSGWGSGRRTCVCAHSRASFRVSSYLILDTEACNISLAGSPPGRLSPMPVNQTLTQAKLGTFSGRIVGPELKTRDCLNHELRFLNNLSDNLRWVCNHPASSVSSHSSPGGRSAH
jgi:hypothetical protein